MKRILPIAIALAFACTLLSGCDRNAANRPAGTGSTADQPGSTPSKPGSPMEKPDQPKRGTGTPAKP